MSMVRKIGRSLVVGALVLAASGRAETIPVTLEAAKDNFGRTNNRNGNNGRSEHLIVAHNPSVKSFVGFDLSSITNEIVHAEFSIRIQNTLPTPASLTIAPMVQTPGNASWSEGVGALGVRGQNARIGESTFQWRAFRDKPWETATGKPAVNMMDDQLWEAPIARIPSIDWKEGGWIRAAVLDVNRLEAIRLSEDPIASFGLWGTAGNGTYFLCSKESGYPATLSLEVKKPAEKGE